MNRLYRIRQHSRGRTRLSFPRLRGRPTLCAKIEQELASVSGISAVEARPRSGSLILLHPDGLRSLQSVVDSIRPLLGRQQVPPAPRGHISGRSLVVSGLYLLWLSVRQLVVAPVSGLLSLPAIATIAISVPVQRQALYNLRESGRPDMGLISTALLYWSLAAGHILTSYTIFWLFNLSSWIESRIERRTRRTIRELLTADRQRVWLLRDGAEIEVETATLCPGDHIVLRQGDGVPIDGSVVRGEALIDESTLSGESEPVLRRRGEQVLSGTVVVDGEFVVEAEHTGDATRLAGIVRMVEQAENDPGTLQLASRRISRTMVPVSVAIAGAGLLLTGNLMQAMAMLVICCPCALRLSSSVAISATMAEASRQGILVKGGRALELAAEMDTLVIDKTGTLTAAATSPLQLIRLDRRQSEARLVRLAAALQRTWPHPLGRGILRKHRELSGEDLPALDTSSLVVGEGVRGELDGTPLLLGSRHFLETQGVVFSAAATQRAAAPPANSSRLFLAVNGRAVALFTGGQLLRTGSAEAVTTLRRNGLSLIMLSGDSQQSVAEISRELHLDRAIGGLSPEAKAEWIEQWRREHPGSIVGMVGDGINDTPAFAAADLSFAIAEGGSDITVEYGDIVLQYGGVDQAAHLNSLARRMKTTIRQSYALALILNGIALAGTATGIFSPVVGALLHNGTTLLSVTRAARRSLTSRENRRNSHPGSAPIFCETTSFFS